MRQRKLNLYGRRLWVFFGLSMLPLGCGGPANAPEIVALDRAGIKAIGELDFIGPKISRTFATPDRIAVGNLDNGDIRDVLAAEVDPTNGLAVLDVLLGDGNGHLASTAICPIPSVSPVHGLAIADINRDGSQDAIALTDEGSGLELWLAFGNGTGQLTPPSAVALQGHLGLGGQLGPAEAGDPLLVEDLNKDGWQDVVVALADGPAGSNTGSKVAVFLGGSGGIPAAPTYYAYQSSGAGFAYLVTSGDWNADGRADIAVAEARASDSLLVMLGDGAGSFSDVRHVQLSGWALNFLSIEPTELISGDFNGDTVPDLAIMNLNGTIFVAPGAGDETLFGPIDNWSGVPTDWTTKTGAADVDGDGLRDLVVSLMGPTEWVVTTSTVFVLHNNGDGTFTETNRLDGAAPLRGGTMADVTVDGRVDMVLSSDDGIVVLVADGTGSFEAATQISLAATAALPGDFDGDGTTDIVLGGSYRSGDSKVMFLRGVGGGALAASDIPSGSAHVVGTPADFTGDGLPDLLIQPDVRIDQGSYGIWVRGDFADVWSNDGAGSFVPGFRVSPLPRPTAIGHVDRDGQAETPDWIDIIEVSDTTVTLRRGGATGIGSSELAFSFADAVTPGGSALADVTGDGINDLLTVRGDRVHIIAGDGTGAFHAFGTLAGGGPLGGFVTADLDLDGQLDVAACSALGEDDGVVLVWQGLGGGSFASPLTVSSVGPGLAQDIRAVDLDGNGAVDLILGQFPESLGYETTGHLRVLLGDGALAFEPQIVIGTRSAGRFGLADLNEDGRWDLVVANQWGALSTMINSTPGDNTTVAGEAIRPVDPSTGTNPVQVSFSTVVASGMTTVQSSSFGQPPHSGYQLGEPPQYFHIATTALVPGTITICIDFNGGSYSNPGEVLIMHYDNGAWTALPPAFATVPTGIGSNWRACGKTLSLSPFALMEPILPKEIVLISTKDAVLHELEPNLNGGVNGQLTVGPRSRALVGFDLSSVDMNRVSSARLVLSVDDSAGLGQGVFVDAHRVLDSWAEGNGQNSRANVLGYGAGATWNCPQDSNIGNRRPDCNSRWLGGSFGPVTAPSVEHKRGGSSEVSWDVTADVLAGGGAGWLIKLRQERNGGRIFYASREGANSGGGSQTTPRLVLTYGR